MTLQSPLVVGIIGTGFAAKRRAEAFQADARSVLRCVAGHTAANTEAFSQVFQVSMASSWQALVEQPDLDLVVIASMNQDHGAMVQAALSAGKHVIVEYPLALDYPTGRALVDLAKAQDKLLHIEHIELLGGVHQALRRYLPEIGTVFSARYATVMPQQPAPRRWTYHREQFGFPLIAALSRLHRLTNLFGPVQRVACQTRFWPAATPDYFQACLCQAQLQFENGILAEVVYGKGEVFHHSDRRFLVEGEQGALVFDGEEGVLIRGETTQTLEVGSRRGLFAQDTRMVLDYLYEGTPLYVRPEESLYALKVAEAARQSTVTGCSQEIAEIN
ncbi:Gfo/Idh/MocA family oxidoreductase [Synechocystis sp. LKSZ1]|uniref:Gfo/Idh/MocA family protein n=1 Tax=Synechocystis sp. LKSZ1 TaxID=3144951 RepID=UPI00336BF592